ncbi:hypothetical protein E3U43_001028 [Larimichthys crocea]|uniref:Uncharacterized protein n=1 Tax=Larimichthys crocea TaxID=215358 RepID=A0ACD3QAQ5_LARCR|nr:hypothetical protein E3U43_001028 [Larimichthys crocea]
MGSTRCSWIVLLLLMVTRDVGVRARAINPLGFGSEPGSGPALRAETRRERCAELAAPWQENARAPEDHGNLLRVRVRPFTQRAAPGPGPALGPGLLFPGSSLFSFVRRVYRCCQDGASCRSVRGIQGRLRGDSDLEFLLTSDVLSLSVLRAELHLQLSNPEHLDVRPVLSYMAKRGLPTRYSLWSRGNTVELRVDLLFLLQSLQEAAGGAAGGGGARLVNMRRAVFPPTTSGALQDSAWGELGLILGCSRQGSGVSCGGVQLSHTPFMALYYR